jgi:hypothetical protein
MSRVLQDNVEGAARQCRHLTISLVMLSMASPGLSGSQNTNASRLKSLNTSRDP